MTGPFSLEMIDVASPCDVPWDSMTGDDRVRFCGECQLHVYHLSAMTRDEAEALINEKEGRLCVQFYRRPDGKVLTQDCPVGVETLRRRLIRKTGLVVGSVFGLIAGLFVTPAVVGPNRGSAKLRQVEPFATVLNWIDPQPTQFRCIGGGMTIRPPSAANGAAETAPPPREVGGE